jgi:hypothetical protein
MLTRVVVLMRKGVSVGHAARWSGESIWWLTPEGGCVVGESGERGKAARSVAQVAVCYVRKARMPSGSVLLAELTEESLRLVTDVLIPGSEDEMTGFDRTWSAVRYGWRSSRGGCRCAAGKLCRQCFMLPREQWRFLPWFEGPEEAYPMGSCHWFSGASDVAGEGRAWFWNMNRMVEDHVIQYRKPADHAGGWGETEERMSEARVR